MSVLNDHQIIDNTSIVTEDGAVIMRCPLPDGDVYETKAQTEESARKHIKQFCEAVRAYQKEKERARHDELMAAKARRQLDPGYQERQAISEGTTQPRKVEGDPKVGVLHWYDTVQERIDELGKLIEQYTQERNELRDQRDEFAPLVAKWRNEA